jgi:hypothetical protein
MNRRYLDFVETTMELDPFADKTVEEKALMLSNKMAKDVDIILSIYISDFVKEAMEENKDFNDMTTKEKRVILDQMAQDKLDSMSPAKQVMTDILGNQNPQQQQPGQQPNAQTMPPLRGNGISTAFNVGNNNQQQNPIA